jgi:hypothetical protein
VPDALGHARVREALRQALEGRHARRLGDGRAGVLPRAARQ